MSDKRFFLWLELQTTGLDQWCEVMEVGAAITDDTITPLTWFHVHMEITGKDSIPYEVKRRHLESGLIADWQKGPRVQPWRAWARLLDVIEAHVPNDAELVLAGSGVSYFDRAIIERECPDLHKRLARWHLDVDVIRRALASSGVNLPHCPKRRAVADVANALRQWMAFTEWMRDRVEPGEL